MSLTPNRKLQNEEKNRLKQALDLRTSAWKMLIELFMEFTIMLKAIIFRTIWTNSVSNSIEENFNTLCMTNSGSI